MRFLLSANLLSVALACRCVAAEINIKTTFDANAVLSPSDLRTIIALASKCGASPVAEVYTYNIHPSSAFGIGVKSVEKIDGRRISFVTVMIDSEKWRRKQNESADVFK